tara:strand:- start:529 stop:837 length:309 start_codon:yes stop_codon:yes gene_type:complete
MSEEEITELALQISESTSGRNISNNDITIMRTYAVGRTIVCYYNVPHAMELDGDDVKNQRVNQMKVSGFGEVFVKNKINFEMWFHKDNMMYLRVVLNYSDFK